jgi:acyl carrier protein
MCRKPLSLFVLVSFFVSSLGPLPKAHANELGLPVPGAMVNLSPAFEPVLIKGLKVHPENPFAFDFILDTGNSNLQAEDPALKQESNKLIKYFLAAMTVPEKNLWVNLSPYEKDRMIEADLGQTEMGRDMLAQDYILKQLTASLIYPEKELGKEFWNKVYAKAQQLYGTSEVPVNTFNKVWIVADKADVFERANVAYVVGAHLKVMLEEDYMAKKLGTAPALSRASGVSSKIIKEVIVPELEKEVNAGKNFAPLRQMFYSMILASWYKMALKDALLTQVYGNQSKVRTGVNAADETQKDKIYQQYLEAYKKGVFNYIREDINEAAKQPMPRKYFSGGLQLIPEDPAQLVHQVNTIPAGVLFRNLAMMAQVVISTKKTSIDRDAAMNFHYDHENDHPELIVLYRALDLSDKKLPDINSFFFGAFVGYKGIPQPMGETIASDKKMKLHLMQGSKGHWLVMAGGGNDLGGALYLGNDEQLARKFFSSFLEYLRSFSGNIIEALDSFTVSFIEQNDLLKQTNGSAPDRLLRRTAARVYLNLQNKFGRPSRTVPTQGIATELDVSQELVNSAIKHLVQKGLALYGTGEQKDTVFIIESLGTQAILNRLLDLDAAMNARETTEKYNGRIIPIGEKLLLENVPVGKEIKFALPGAIPMSRGFLIYDHQGVSRPFSVFPAEDNTVEVVGKRLAKGQSTEHYGVKFLFDGENITVTNVDSGAWKLFLLMPADLAMQSRETVLVVDDGPFYREVIANKLIEKGYKVVTANDGQEALDMLQKDPGHFRLLISDLSMPRLDGVGLTQRIPALDHDLPVIVLSSVFGRETESTLRAIPNVREVLAKTNAMGGAEEFLAKVRQHALAPSTADEAMRTPDEVQPMTAIEVINRNTIEKQIDAVALNGEAVKLGVVSDNERYVTINGQPRIKIFNLDYNVYIFNGIILIEDGIWFYQYALKSSQELFGIWWDVQTGTKHGASRLANHFAPYPQNTGSVKFSVQGTNLLGSVDGEINRTFPLREMEAYFKKKLQNVPVEPQFLNGSAFMGEKEFREAVESGALTDIVSGTEWSKDKKVSLVQAMEGEDVLAEYNRVWQYKNRMTNLIALVQNGRIQFEKPFHKQDKIREIISGFRNPVALVVSYLDRSENIVIIDAAMISNLSGQAPLTEQDILRTIQQILSKDPFKHSADVVNYGTNLEDDLVFDSLDKASFRTELETAFNMTITEDEMASLKQISEVVSLIKRKSTDQAMKVHLPFVDVRDMPELSVTDESRQTLEIKKVQIKTSRISPESDRFQILVNGVAVQTRFTDGFKPDDIVGISGKFLVISHPLQALMGNVENYMEVFYMSGNKIEQVAWRDILAASSETFAQRYERISYIVPALFNEEGNLVLRSDMREIGTVFLDALEIRQKEAGMDGADDAMGVIKVDQELKGPFPVNGEVGIEIPDGKYRTYHLSNAPSTIHYILSRIGRVVRIIGTGGANYLLSVGEPPQNIEGVLYSFDGKKVLLKNTYENFILEISRVDAAMKAENAASALATIIAGYGVSLTAETIWVYHEQIRALSSKNLVLYSTNLVLGGTALGFAAALYLWNKSIGETASAMETQVQQYLPGFEQRDVNAAMNSEDGAMNAGNDEAQLQVQILRKIRNNILQDRSGRGPILFYEASSISQKEADFVNNLTKGLKVKPRSSFENHHPLDDGAQYHLTTYSIGRENSRVLLERIDRKINQIKSTTPFPEDALAQAIKRLGFKMVNVERPTKYAVALLQGVVRDPKTKEWYLVYHHADKNENGWNYLEFVDHANAVVLEYAQWKNGPDRHFEGRLKARGEEFKSIKILNTLKEIERVSKRKSKDAAQVTGGIDLDRAKMQMNVGKQGSGVQMQFDTAMIQKIKQEGFDGVEFKINSIVPVSLPLILGLRKEEEELCFAKS